VSELADQGLFHGRRAKERDPTVRRIFFVLTTRRKDEFLWIPGHESRCTWRFDLVTHFARLRRNLQRERIVSTFLFPSKLEVVARIKIVRTK
jgi:hypothetical protein